MVPCGARQLGTIIVEKIYGRIWGSKRERGRKKGKEGWKEGGKESRREREVAWFMFCGERCI